jgi:8-oxo-dGTP pyrophosphatase MutT (NUDIX family)
LFISEEPPHGITVVVLRPGTRGVEFLILHREPAGSGGKAEPAGSGGKAEPAGSGDWAWAPPARVRLPGEPVDACARRELEETTGLTLPLRRVPLEPAWAAFWAQAPIDAEIRLSREHDRFDWVDLDEAVERCRPVIVAEQFRILAEAATASAA